MSRVGRRVVALLLALAGSGCAQERTGPGAPSSSGSNWLRCEELADCSAASQAVACRADGFCTDFRGERIALSSIQGGGHDAQVRAEPRIVGDAQIPTESGDESDAGAAAPCPWGVGSALREAGVMAPERRNCGSYAWPGESTLATALACFNGAIVEQMAAQISFQRCSDCVIHATYVMTEGGERFEVILEDDVFGADDQRTVTVQSCEAFDTDPLLGLTCSGAAPRYSCSELRGSPSAIEPDPPVEPFKLADVTTPVAGASATLHLYVSNQSFSEPLVDIEVRIESDLVVLGDFAVEGQHNWYAFDIEVPIGPLQMYAVSFSVDEAVSLSQNITVPEERWAVLNYWYAPGDSEGRHFTLTVSDVPVSFE